LVWDLRRLEDAGYVACRKAFIGRRPKSTYRITPDGRKALAGYLNAMQQVIDAVADKARGNK
jgi:DNA-binding PadR family transcriptional regulator